MPNHLVAVPVACLVGFFESLPDDAKLLYSFLDTTKAEHNFVIVSRQFDHVPEGGEIPQSRMDQDGDNFYFK